VLLETQEAEEVEEEEEEGGKKEVSEELCVQVRW